MRYILVSIFLRESKPYKKNEAKIGEKSKSKFRKFKNKNLKYQRFIFLSKNYLQKNDLDTAIFYDLIGRSIGVYIPLYTPQEWH